MVNLKNIYQKTLVSLGLLMSGVSPVFAGDSITVDTFKKTDLGTGATNLESGVKTGANIGISIVIYLAIFLGLVFLLWGSYMMASKDQREEGKLKDGVKLAILGVIFLTVSFVVKKLTGAG